jgi:hypothetical protein
LPFFVAFPFPDSLAILSPNPDVKLFHVGSDLLVAIGSSYNGSIVKKNNKNALLHTISKKIIWM